MAATARGRVLRVAQSAELRATFRQMAEIEGPRGPKYPRACLAEVAAAVAGRTYGTMLLELCHLVRAATLAAPGTFRMRGFEWLFWGVETARRGAYRAAFDGAGINGSALVDVREGGVVLAYPHTTFEVRYGRMPSLAAMMEFLVSLLGYRDVVQSVESLATVSATPRTVADAANELSRRLYAVLGDHLPAAQEQRRFHAMTAFLERVAGADFTEDDIDDSAVLDFWLARAVDSESADFRGYRSTWRGFLRLIRVLAESTDLANVDEPMEMEAGMADRIAEPIIAHRPEGGDPLDALGEAPAATVKALTKRHMRLLETPVGDPDGVRRLPLSYLRSACFGALQGRLSQALRRKAGEDEIGTLVAEANRVGYAEHLALLDDAAAQVRLVAQACLHVLRQTGDAEVGGPTEVAVLAEAREAFNALNRAGFDRAALTDPERRPAFVALADILPDIAERLRTAKRALEASPWQASEAPDRRTFADAFDRLYGTLA